MGDSAHKMCIRDRYLGEEVDDIAAYFKVDVSVVEQLLYTLQQLDPAGVCARNLEECLSLQLERRQMMTPVLATLIDKCPVSYTHLDVYKRQLYTLTGSGAGLLFLPECLLSLIFDAIHGAFIPYGKIARYIHARGTRHTVPAGGAAVPDPHTDCAGRLFHRFHTRFVQRDKGAECLEVVFQLFHR